MKQLFTILFLTLTTGIFAQAPQSIPYQAVVRNPDGSIMANTAMIITFKIHDNTATGTVVYEENHTATTNTQGLISLNVGNGVVVSGTFSGINWGAGSKFLHVLMNAGNGVVDLGTQQMMSVPYSLYSESSNSTNLSVSATGDTLFQGNGDFIIIPGISSSNGLGGSHGGLGSSVLSPYIQPCVNEYISVSSCLGQNTISYNGYNYNLTEIGGQCWFAENLQTVSFNDGLPISNITDAGTWSSTNYPGYCWYENLSSNASQYGAIYNWYAVTTDKLCPAGWHVPSDCEWMYLEKYLGLPVTDIWNQANYRFDNDIAKYLLGEGYSGGINLVGFNAKPAPGRSIYGQFTNPLYANSGSSWWTSSGNTGNFVIGRNTSIAGNGAYSLSRSLFYQFKDGISVRCIKD